MVNLATNYIPERRKANKAQVAEFFGVSLKTIDEWLLKGIPYIERGEKGAPWVFDLLKVAEWRLLPRMAAEAQGEDENFNPDALAPKDRLDWYRSESQKRTLQQQDRTLIPASEFERAAAALVKVSVNWAETLPDVLERDLGLSPEQVERAQLLVDRQRERLHAALVKEASDV